VPGIREAQRDSAMDLMRQVAVQIIAQGGYSAMTLAEVGELAGYSRGLATHHFGSKAGLLESVLDSILDRNAKEFRKVTEGRQGRDRLAAVIDCTLYRCVETPDHARAYLLLSLEPTARWATSKISGQTHSLREEAAAAAQEAIDLGEIASEWDPADLASITSAMARGYAYEWAADPTTNLPAARRHISAFIAALPSGVNSPQRRQRNDQPAR
jgi:AcrR family transcriptional regulator